MITIAAYEFRYLFKGFKSLIVILMFLAATYLTAKLVNHYPMLLHSSNGAGGMPFLPRQNIIYFAGLRMLVVFFGFLFVMVLSHDTINRELEIQTIRLLVTKTSRTSLIIGKYLGILTFWFLVLFISFFLAVLMSKEFFAMMLVQMLSFISFAISLSLFLSLIIKKGSLSIVTALFSGFAFPIIGLWSVYSHNFIMRNIVKYLLPYFYFVYSNLLTIVPLLISWAVLGLSIYLFKRRDL